MLEPYTKPSFITRIFVLISQTVNVICFNGFPDEMFSARCYRERNDPIWEKRRVFLDKVYFWQDQHCQQCFVWEESRIDLPGDYNDIN